MHFRRLGHLLGSSRVAARGAAVAVWISPITFPKNNGRGDYLSRRLAVSGHWNASLRSEAQARDLPNNPNKWYDVYYHFVSCHEVWDMKISHFSLILLDKVCWPVEYFRRGGRLLINSQQHATFSLCLKFPRLCSHFHFSLLFSDYLHFSNFLSFWFVARNHIMENIEHNR